MPDGCIIVSPASLIRRSTSPRATPNVPQAYERKEALDRRRQSLREHHPASTATTTSADGHWAVGRLPWPGRRYTCGAALSVDPAGVLTLP